MPIRRKRLMRKRKTVRKTYKRKSRTVPRTPGPPKYQSVKLRYTHLYLANVLPGNVATQVYRLNSLFDPDYSGVGYQPYYHDQYSALYDNYRVYGCKVYVKVSCASSTTNMFHPTVLIAPTDQASVSWGNMQNACNARKAQFRNLVPGQSVSTFKAYYSIADVMGVAKREVASDDNYSAAVSANPNSVAYLQVITGNNDATASIAVTWEIRLTFYARYFGLTVPAPS